MRYVLVFTVFDLSYFLPIDCICLFRRITSAMLLSKSFIPVDTKSFPALGHWFKRSVNQSSLLKLNSPNILD